MREKRWSYQSPAMENFTPDTFPFKTTLNLKLLTEYWENSLKSDSCPVSMHTLLEQISTTPALKSPIENPEVLEQHKDLINFMMTAIVSPAFAHQDLTGAITPFQFKSFYSTPAFQKALPLDRMDLVTTNIPGNKMLTGKIMRACIIILNKFYHANIVVDKPLLFTVHDEVTGLDKTYAVEINDRFCEVIHKGELRPIDQHVIRFLTEKLFDVDLWLQYIRPQDFEFQGFMIFRLVDVTEQDMLSSIKYDLLRRNSVTDAVSFFTIQQKLRSIFRISDLRLGIAYFDPNNNLIVNSGINAWKSVIQQDNQSCESEYTGSVYERAWQEQRYLTIVDLESYPFKTDIERSLLKNGVRGLLLAPLIDDHQIIGMLELATPQHTVMNPISSHKVEAILPMFTAAVKRVQEEMATEVRAIIQEECTAIHPTVQWRFFEAGVSLMNKRRAGQHASLEEIAFKDIYPLFGMVDVRNSSMERNTSIQKDLQQNLKMAKDVLQRIAALKPFPLVDELVYRTDEQLKKITSGLAAGDESNVLEFLKSEINPVIRHFENDQDVQKWITRYNNHLDPAIGVVYRRRKAFEDSLAIINKTIGSLVDEAQKSAQAIFPHYFEKYQTDGVEFTLYLGSALVKGQTFNPFYLKNFRLWQLLLMCDIHRKMEELKPTLKNNLDITQLILVHDQTISIRFRPDEKQFDVDGAYDIRYEIVKKRIDKAYLKNTNERLTQPGKIAIVYSQGRVEEEYRRYFQYLISKNVIKETIEEVELEELPGATGLRALRIELTGTTPVNRVDLIEELEEALKA